MSDCFYTSVPWSRDAVKNAVDDKMEAEIILLQQHIIDELQSPQSSSLDIDADLISQIAQLEISLSNAHRTQDSTLQSLIATQKELDQSVKSGIVNTKDLQQQIQQLTIKLTIAEQTKLAVINSNYELERKTANKDYQTQIIQGQLDKKNAAYNILHKEHYLLKSDHIALVERDKTNSKAISHLSAEVAGFDKRIENMRLAERARLTVNQAVVPDQSHDPVPAPVVSDLKDKQIASLNLRIKELTDQKSAMNEDLMRSKSNEERHVKESARLLHHAQESTGIMDRATEEMEAQANLAIRLDSSMQKILAEYSQQTIDLDKIKRENMYLLQMLDYQEMRTIWKHDDGTAIYIISCDPTRALSLNDGQEERQSLVNPVCWVMNTNGTGHIVMINEEQDQLLYPTASRGKTALNKKHKDAVLEAIKNITITQFNESLKHAVRRAQNVCNAADLLDINWSEPLNVDKLLGQIMKDDLKKADMLEAQKSANVISKLAELNRKGLKVSVKTRNQKQKQKRNSNKRK